MSLFSIGVKDFDGAVGGGEIVGKVFRARKNEGREGTNSQSISGREATTQPTLQGRGKGEKI